MRPAHSAMRDIGSPREGVMSTEFVSRRRPFCQVNWARCTMRRMRVHIVVAPLLATLAVGGCKSRSPARAPDGGAVAATAAPPIVTTPPNAPTRVQCRDDGCPALDAGPARDGGELVIHVEAEPAILCDLVEHDAWSRWIVE